MTQSFADGPLLCNFFIIFVPPAESSNNLLARHERFVIRCAQTIIWLARLQQIPQALNERTILRAQ
jgi:hypothetical protein